MRAAASRPGACAGSWLLRRAHRARARKAGRVCRSPARCRGPRLRSRLTSNCPRSRAKLAGSGGGRSSIAVFAPFLTSAPRMCLSARHRGSIPLCTVIAPIPAAPCAQATSARRCGCPAGATASATMAACCSSTCATTTASPRWWPIPTRPAFKEAEKLRSEWVVRIDGKVRRRPAGTENPDLPTGAVEVYITRDRGAGRRPASCRCRCSASRNTRRTSG